MNISDTEDRCPHCGRHLNIERSHRPPQRETVYRHPDPYLTHDQRR